MRRFTFYIAAVLLACGVFTLQFERSAHAQKTKPRAFYIETQADSPILIRDLTATILPESSTRNAPEIEVTLYLENKTKKNILLYDFDDLAADGSGKVSADSSSYLNLSAGELIRTKFTYPLTVKSLVYRITTVKFEDGTEWSAKPFNASKAKKSAPVTALARQLSDPARAKRTLALEWTKPIFEDRVLKSFDINDETIEGVKIRVKVNVIKPEQLADIEDCPPTPEQWAERVKEMEEEQKRIEAARKDSQQESNYGNFISTETNYEVEEFKSYSFGGRIFAYSVESELLEAENQSKIGVGMQNLYVDETGDGTFKMRCDEMDLETLPQWVRDLAGK